jgi:ABC-type glycerol-3-phosphate transport system substrate-binding protein
VVSKSSPNSDESWKLVKFLTDSEQQLALFSEVSKIRPFGSIYSNKALSQNLLTNGYLKPAIESAPYAKTAEIAGRSGNRRQCDALKKAVNEVISGKTSKEALITAKADIIK